MGEHKLQDCTFYYTDINGDTKPLDFNFNTIQDADITWETETSEKEKETLEKLTQNVDTVIEFNPVSISTDKVRAVFDQADIKLNYEFAEELKEELKEILRKESQKVIDEKTEFWCQAFLNFINGEENPFDPKLYQNATNTASEIIGDLKIAQLVENNEKNKHIDSLDSLTYAIEETNRLTKETINTLQRFAESSKIVYNKEKEKKGEEMNRTVAIVRFWDQKQNKLGTKNYYYFYNPITGHACFDNLQRKYWIRNDTGFVYENPVVFESLVSENKLSKENLQKITKTIVHIKPFEEIININSEENKGDNKMNFNKIFPNAEIGKANGVKMSVYGPAFHTYEEREVAFKNGEWIDVTGLTFDFCPAYVCPVKASEIAAGDFIKHLNCWCRIIGIDGVNITAENITAHEVITILPMKSMFGFDFYSKLILPFGDFSSDIGDIFSNPFMTMMLFGGDFKDFNDMLPLMLMSGGKFDMSNPMMLYFLMRGSNGDKTGGINFDIGF